MSTAGSSPETAAAQTPLTPASDASIPSIAEQLTPDAGRRKRVAIFRWRGIFGLLAIVVVVGLVWMLFGKLWVRRTLESSASQSLGTEVDIAGLGIDLQPGVELHGLQIADPFDRTRNLLEAKTIRVKLNADALLQKKVVIEDLTFDGVKASTRRATPAREMPAGFIPRAMTQLTEFKKQFQVPLLSLTPIDTIKALVLDPTQLNTVKRARQLVAKGDSIRGTLTTGVQDLKLAETVDSARALVTRLKGKNPVSLGLTGTRNAVNDVRRLAARLDSTKKRVDGLIAAARAGVDSITAATRAVDDARKADYAFAKGLLKLPTVDAPNIGPALFGNVSIDAFQQAMYWVSLGKEYAPPGLLPREKPGPKRLRRAGETIHFVELAKYPDFLLKSGNITVQLDSNARFARGNYRLTASNVTTEPALVGKPMAFGFERAAAGSAVENFSAHAALDNTTKTSRVAMTVKAGGVSLPGFALPGTPLRAELGRGTSNLSLKMNGDSIVGTWVVSAPSPAWVLDSARGKAMNTMEQLVARVIQQIHNVDLTAEITGTVKAPKLAVKSNLDRAVADGIKSVVGEEVAKAEAKVRAQVDAEAEKAMAPVRAKAVELRAEVDQKAKEAQTRLDDAKKQLADQLKSLGGGLLGGT